MSSHKQSLIALRQAGCTIADVSRVLDAPTSRSAEKQASALVRAWVGRSDGLESMVERVGGVDQVGIEERVASLTRRSIKKESKLWALDLAIRMMDLTTLEGKDTEGKVRALCAKGMRPDPSDPTIPSVAAICIYPAMIPVARKALAGSGVKIASVSTGFPSGQTYTDVKILETRQAVEAGADEIDMVIDRGAFLEGEYRHEIGRASCRDIVSRTSV